MTGRAGGPPLFVELCAGTAALSLRLHRAGAKPPVSRMGAKTGYANAILRILGLTPGQGARAYLWCEPDAGVRLLLHAYRDATLARAAAGIIRSWAAEDPRALWERLRAEGPPRLPEGEVDAGEVARSYLLGAWSFRQSEPSSGFVASEAHDRPGCPGGRQSATTLAGSVGAILQVPATIAPDARTIDPREVARWAWVQGHGSPDGRLAAQYQNPDGNADGSWKAPPPDWLARRADSLPHLAAALIHPDARTIDPPALPPGTVVFCDPPYQNTTPYAHDLPRAEVVALARRWAAAGATVAISEAEPIPELVAEGWHAVRIDGERVGQKRTFSRQQQEWVTLNRAPAWVPPVQGGLFGGAR